MAPVDAMAAALLSATAIACLWRAWNGRGWPWTLASLASGMTALLLWGRLAGAEFGSVYALGATALGAWAWIAVTATPAGGKVAIDRPRRTAPPSAAALLRGLGAAALAGPLALAVSLVTCLHAVYWLPGAPAGRWVTAAFALPLLWAAVATALLCVDRRRRAALVLGVLAGLGTLLLPSGSLA